MWIKEKVKKYCRKILYGYKSDSESFIQYLRARGAHIGNEVVFFEPMNTSIDISRPYLISIGDKVQITKGCTILTHGYDWSVFKGMSGEILGKAESVEIGNNVFIGRNVTIMGNCKIGDNVIIGADSIVTKDIPSNTVAVGSPAHVISSIEDYYEKRKRNQLDDAFCLVQHYHKAFDKYPPEEELREFFWLFTPRNTPIKNKVFVDVMELLGNREVSYEAFEASRPSFDNYDMFISYCKERQERCNEN